MPIPPPPPPHTNCTNYMTQNPKPGISFFVYDIINLIIEMNYTHREFIIHLRKATLLNYYGNLRAHSPISTCKKYF